MAFLQDIDEIKTGLIIFRRADVKHRNWYCRVKVPASDRYKVVSLKTPNHELAREKALECDADIRFRLKHDVPVFNRPFQEIAADYLKIQEARAGVREITKDRATVVATAIRTLNLYLGPMQIHAIGQDKWDNYAVWRRQNGRRPSGWLTRKYRKKPEPPKEDGEQKVQKAPKPVSSWTIRHEMIVFRSIMTYAANHKFIPQSHIPKGDAIKATERREEFTREEYRALHTKGRAWVKQATTARQKWCRDMTYLYTLVMCNTGMRPPEGKNLLWRDVSITSIDKETRGKENKSAEVQFTNAQQRAAAEDAQGDRRRIVILNVRGKGKARRLVAPANVADYLDRVHKIAKVTGPDDHVFSTSEGKRDSFFYARMVREMFIATGLLKGPAGTERSSYCFRHTYATLRLSEGVNDLMLAEQMGTSVQIIQEHYGHIHPVKNADRILLGMHAWELPEGESETTTDAAAGDDRVNKVAAARKAVKRGAAGKGPREQGPGGDRQKSKKIRNSKTSH
ncbi:MAG: hypothetical protein ACYCZX_13475 [Rhodospirillaceae bacterium]